MKHKSHIHGSDTMHSFSSAGKEILPLKPMLILFAAAVVVGSLAGFGISRFTNASQPSAAAGETEGGEEADSAETPKSAGIIDEELFPDEAEGTMTAGGIEGEGTHHLQRKGGESQNVYLTSSAVDLSAFEGKEVRVMGKTHDTEKAGWFMDVGYIELK
jgi:hypothetical protein